ncbi:MAG: hypothetical protein IKX31_01115 [Muribaculaceae bacterium]|nr:hypothetical protein [Muribaculaceae bacterium]
MANEIKVWNKVMSAALKLPGVAVDREKFLRSALKKHCCDSHISAALDKGTAGIVPNKILDKIAADCIKSHTKKVTILSAAMGVPGGWATLGTIPTDIAQFYYHVFVVAQKLAYIYGYPDMRDEKGNLSEGATNLLTIFVGVMTGVAVAAKALQELGKMLQKQIIKKLPEYALSNGALQIAVRKIAKKVGMELSKNGISEGVGKLIPVVSGFISGALTYRSFKPQAQRLGMSLHNTMLLLPQRSSASQVQDIDYQELPPDLPPASE